jgi:DNA-binding PadR family transcriptional regulator
MPRRMPVEGVPIALPAQWLLLGLVLEQQSHAYALGQRYKERFGSLVPMPPTSVYRNLDFLAEHGYVKSTTVACPPAARRFRTPSVVYEATATGEKVYRQWLISEVPAKRWREERVARISAGSFLGVQGLSELVEGYEQNRSTQEKRLEQLLDEHVADQSSLTALASRLAISEQLVTLGAQGAWVEDARQELRQHSE